MGNVNSTRCCCVSNLISLENVKSAHVGNEAIHRVVCPLTDRALPEIFLSSWNICVIEGTWKVGFQAIYSYHPQKVGRSDLGDPWCCQKRLGGIQLYACVQNQKYLIPYRCTVGLWRKVGRSAFRLEARQNYCQGVYIVAVREPAIQLTSYRKQVARHGKFDAKKLNFFETVTRQRLAIPFTKYVWS